MLPYQALYVHCIDQIQYLFEDWLSDKLYFRTFTHVVVFPQKQNYKMKGKHSGSTLLFIFLVGQYCNFINSYLHIFFLILIKRIKDGKEKQ